MCFSSVQRSVNVEASTGVGRPGSVEGMQSTAESEQSKEEEGVAGGRGCDQSLGSPELGILAADNTDEIGRTTYHFCMVVFCSNFHMTMAC